MFVKTMTPYPHSLLGFLRAPDDESGSGAPAGDGDSEDGDQGDGDEGGDEGQPERTYSQRDMDRIRRRETDKANRRGRADLLAELGVTDPKEAKRLIEQAAKAAERDKSEQDKLRDKATAAETAAAEAKREAAQAKLERSVDRALVTAGVQPKRMERIAKLVHGELTEDEPDADDIKAAIESVKDDFPEAFADDDGDDGGKRRAPSTEGRGGTPARGTRGGAKEDPAARGAERARKMQGRTAATA